MAAPSLISVGKRLLILSLASCFTLILFSLSIFSSATKAAAPSSAEVKAGLIYNLFRYTVWLDKGANSPVMLCVFSTNGDVVKNLMLINDNYKSQPVMVIRPLVEFGDASVCDAVYFNAFEDGVYKKWKTLPSRRSPMSVSDIEHFTERGGDVEIKVLNGRYGFEIALKRLVDKKIKISSLVLDLSEISEVDDATP